MLWQEALQTWTYQRTQSGAAFPRYRRIVSRCACGDPILIPFRSRPNATSVASPADRDIVAKDGLAVVECSWARLAEVPFSKIASPHERLRMRLIITRRF